LMHTLCGGLSSFFPESDPIGNEPPGILTISMADFAWLPRREPSKQTTTNPSGGIFTFPHRRQFSGSGSLIIACYKSIGFVYALPRPRVHLKAGQKVSALLFRLHSWSRKNFSYPYRGRVKS
jgi:hypothetical protein